MRRAASGGDAAGEGGDDSTLRAPLLAETTPLSGSGSDGDTHLSRGRGTPPRGRGDGDGGGASGATGSSVVSPSRAGYAATGRLRRASSARSVGSDAPAEYDVLTVNPEHAASAQPSRRRQQKLDMDSFDFEPYSSEAHVVTMEQKNAAAFAREDRARWTLTFFVGVVTALIAVMITWASTSLTSIKFDAVASIIQREKDTMSGHGIAYLAFVGFGMSYALAAALPVMLAPIAAGSGISEIKCVLNGVKLPKATRISTLMAKVIGVIFSVASGLPVGKEGPMIHSGAVVGAGLSQGKSTTMGFDTSYTKFKEFRNDIEKRDFIVVGSAAGVAAAFGAPIGGVLFALEEGASYWFQNLTWRAFFCAMVSTYTLDVCFSAIHKGVTFGNLSEPGMFTFGDFTKQNTLNRSYHIYEIPAFILLGVLGGLAGALFNAMNKKISVYRARSIKTKPAQLGEVLLVAFVVCTVTFLVPFVEYAIYGDDACSSIAPVVHNYSFTKDLVQFYCPKGQYSELATLFFAPSEGSIHQLFHFPLHFSIPKLMMFFVMYASLTCWTYGLKVPSGLFIPSLLTGSALGRFVGEVLFLAFGEKAVVDPGTYALIGAAAMLGGMARMTISLAVILLESTGDYQYGLPLMLTLMAARWTGNAFNEGLYDIHIHLNRWPLLEQEPDPLLHHLRTKDLMTAEPVAVPSVVRVGELVSLLESNQHHGYPVIHPRSAWATHPRLGTLAGIIHRKHLCILLHFYRFLDEPPDFTVPRRKLRAAVTDRTRRPVNVKRAPVQPHERRAVLTWDDLEGTYPRYPTIASLRLSDADREKYIDLRPYMHRSPATVKSSAPAIHAFRLFRGLGMRHLCVIDDNGDVVGIVTRRDVTHEHILEQYNRLRRRGMSASHDFVGETDIEDDGGDD